MNRRLEIPCIPCPSCCSLLPKGGISYHERGGVCFRDMLQGNDRNVRLSKALGRHGAGLQICGGKSMSKKLGRWGRILVAGAALAAFSSAAEAVDPGINQPGVRGGTTGVGAPGVGVRDPGINQPGAAGNVGVRDPGINQPGAAGNVGVRDPGINQPGAAGNVRGVARRTVRY